MPLAEQLLWYDLRNKQLCGYKFRRQYSIGKYILDFFCPKIKLGIEIDGNSHYYINASNYDEKRRRYLESFGIKIIRFTNTEIYTNRKEVLENINNLLPPLAPPL